MAIAIEATVAAKAEITKEKTTCLSQVLELLKIVQSSCAKVATHTETCNIWIGKISAGCVTPDVVENEEGLMVIDLRCMRVGC
jgi:hypothetical protein